MGILFWILDLWFWIGNTLHLIQNPKSKINLMNSFHPTLRSIDPPYRPDYLAEGVLHSLSRSRLMRPPWGLVQTIVIAGLSFGIIPLLVWPRRFRNFVIIEQQQLWHLAEWMRLQSGHPAADDLCREAQAVRFRRIFWIISLALLSGIVAVFAVQIGRNDRFVEQLIASTYRYSSIGQNPRVSDGLISSSLALQLFSIWTLGLSLAALCHWMQVRFHMIDVGRFVRRMNELTQEHGVTPADPPKFMLDRATTLPWLLAGILPFWFSIYWTLPLMLAGGAHRNYISASARMRAQLAHQVRSLLVQRRPAMNVPMPVGLQLICRTPLCRTSLPREANFCPRCGRRAVAKLNHVA